MNNIFVAQKAIADEIIEILEDKDMNIVPKKYLIALNCLMEDCEFGFYPLQKAGVSKEHSDIICELMIKTFMQNN